MRHIEIVKPAKTNTQNNNTILEPYICGRYKTATIRGINHRVMAQLWCTIISSWVRTALKYLHTCVPFARLYRMYYLIETNCTPGNFCFPAFVKSNTTSYILTSIKHTYVLYIQ